MILLTKFLIIRKHSKPLTQSGFTLIELIIYMGILSVLLLVFSNFFATIIDTRLSSQKVTSVDQDREYLFNRLLYDVHRATAITAPAAIGQSGNTLTLIIDGTAHTYQITGTTLTLTNPSDTYQLNSHDTRITSFTVTRVGVNSFTETVRISLTLESQAVTNTGPETRTIQTTIGLR